MLRERLDCTNGIETCACVSTLLHLCLSKLVESFPSESLHYFYWLLILRDALMGRDRGLEGPNDVER